MLASAFYQSMTSSRRRRFGGLSALPVPGNPVLLFPPKEEKTVARRRLARLYNLSLFFLPLLLLLLMVPWAGVGYPPLPGGFGDASSFFRSPHPADTQNWLRRYLPGWPKTPPAPADQEPEPGR